MSLREAKTPTFNGGGGSGWFVVGLQSSDTVHDSASQDLSEHVSKSAISSSSTLEDGIMYSAASDISTTSASELIGENIMVMAGKVILEDPKYLDGVFEKVELSDRRYKMFAHLPALEEYAYALPGCKYGSSYRCLIRAFLDHVISQPDLDSSSRESIISELLLPTSELAILKGNDAVIPELHGLAVAFYDCMVAGDKKLLEELYLDPVFDFFTLWLLQQVF